MVIAGSVSFVAPFTPELGPTGGGGINPYAAYQQMMGMGPMDMLAQLRSYGMGNKFGPLYDSMASLTSLGGVSGPTMGVPSGSPTTQAAQYAQANFARFDTAKYGGSPDGLISRDDLKAVMEDTSGKFNPADKKCAAQLLTDFSSLDQFQNGGKPDGLIGFGDLGAYLNSQGAPSMGTSWPPTSGFAVQPSAYQTGMTQTQAAQYVQANFSKFDTAKYGGSPDGLISRDDLHAVIGDTTGRFSAHDRIAAQTLLNGFGSLDQFQNGGNPDGLIGFGDLGKYLQSCGVANLGTNWKPA